MTESERTIVRDLITAIFTYENPLDLRAEAWKGAEDLDLLNAVAAKIGKTIMNASAGLSPAPVCRAFAEPATPIEALTESHYPMGSDNGKPPPRPVADVATKPLCENCLYWRPASDKTFSSIERVCENEKSPRANQATAPGDCCSHFHLRTRPLPDRVDCPFCRKSVKVVDVIDGKFCVYRHKGADGKVCPGYSEPFELAPDGPSEPAKK